MIVQNDTSYNIDVPEITNPTYAPAPLVLIPATPTTIFNDDAERSVTLKNLIADASVSVVDSTTEPTTGVSRIMITGTTAAVAGTRSTHTHTLGYTPTKVIIVPTAADDDVPNAAAISLVTASTTTITVKSDGDSIGFSAYLL
jgi:hypothetical protein